MVVTALPVVEAQLHQPLAIVQWLTTGYTLVIGIITPLSANLYEKYNNRQFFLAIIALFLGGTIVGCLATNFWTLLGARLIQAAAGGLLVSLQMTTLVTIFPPGKTGHDHGIIIVGGFLWTGDRADPGRGDLKPVGLAVDFWGRLAFHVPHLADQLLCPAGLYDPAGR